MYKIYMPSITNLGSVIFASILLTACGGGSDGNSTESGTSSFTLGITDAPVDGAEKVAIRFTGVEIMSEDSEAHVINFAEPKTLDLLALQGGVRDLLLDGEELPADQYGQIRLMVQAEHDTIMDSYIVINGAQHELRVPSGNQSGLKLIKNFELEAGETSDFTIDFDLRKSVVFAPGQGYMLKPVLRLVETPATGKISGTVAPSVFTGQTCSSDPLTGYSVYLYQETGILPNDLGSTNAPIATAKVTLNESSLYSYTLGFVEPRTYKIAVTCTADMDDPEKDDDVNLLAAADVTASANTTTTHNFQ